MPRVNAPARSLDDLTVGELRRLLHGGMDESLTIADALTALHESDRMAELHERDTAAYEAYATRRAALLAAALSEAVTAADKANLRDGDGARMAARQAARLETAENFDKSHPLLDFADWQQAGQPDVPEVGVIRRAAQTLTELVR